MGTCLPLLRSLPRSFPRSLAPSLPPSLPRSLPPSLLPSLPLAPLLPVRPPVPLLSNQRRFLALQLDNACALARDAQVGCIFYFTARLLKMDSTTWVTRSAHTFTRVWPQFGSHLAAVANLAAAASGLRPRIWLRPPLGWCREFVCGRVWPQFGACPQFGSHAHTRTYMHTRMYARKCGCTRYRMHARTCARTFLPRFTCNARMSQRGARTHMHMRAKRYTFSGMHTQGDARRRADSSMRIRACGLQSRARRRCLAPGHRAQSHTVVRPPWPSTALAIRAPCPARGRSSTAFARVRSARVRCFTPTHASTAWSERETLSEIR